MIPDIPHRFVIINLIRCPHAGCPNLSDDPSEAGSVVDASPTKCPYNNILEHAPALAPPCVKPVAKASTTYRDHYCGRKGMPRVQKICLPFQAIHLSGDKMGVLSTYKDDFHSYSAKDLEASRGRAVAQRQHLGCAEKVFEGMSETKNAFRLPVRKQRLVTTTTAASPLKEIGKFVENIPFSGKTTYASEFKKPKKCEKTVSYTPKHNIAVSREPFKHVSHYMNEFQYPKKKIDLCERSPWRKFVYRPPSVPMDRVTTYGASFAFKKVSGGTRRRPAAPDRRCQECKTAARDKVQLHSPAVGDKDRNSRRSRIGDGPQHPK